MKNTLTVFSFLFLLSNSLKSQEISGIVADFDSMPIAGASVMIKGTTKGISTDINGRYKIEVDSLHNNLVFSFIGYHTQEIQINDKKTINIALEEESVLLETIVYTEYKRKAIKEGDITRIIKIEHADKTDTIRYSLTPTFQVFKLVEDSVRVSNIVANKIATDGMRKYYIIDDFYNRCAIESIWDFLFKRIQYPIFAKEHDIQGRVYARFTIDIEGNIKDIKIIRTIDNSLGDEVFNALKAIPKWLNLGMRDANMRHGKAVELTYILPILFEIEEIK